MERGGALRRLQKEYKAIQEEAATSRDVILLLDHGDDLNHWHAYIEGPSETPYAGAYFQLEVVVPDGYPMRPPSVRFVTRVFHPNVLYKTGEICLDLLKDAWTPAFTLISVCRAIITLLAHPEPSSPLNCDSGNLLRGGDLRGFNSLARFYTHLHAVFDLPKDLKKIQ